MTPRAAASVIAGNLNQVEAAQRHSGLVERRRRPHWDDLASHWLAESRNRRPDSLIRGAPSGA